VQIGRRGQATVRRPDVTARGPCARR
jgi:hypothetical protein